MTRLVLFLFITLLQLPQLFATSNPELSDRLRRHVSVLASDSLLGRGLGTEGAEKARAYIIQQFKTAGIKPLKGDLTGFIQPFSFRQSNTWIQAYNIVGVIEGSDPELKNEYILIGAHYDHLGYELNDDEKKIFPGADDNASGVASIIEIGRYFAANPKLLKRSLLIVAFDAEESGLLGSEHFVQDSPVPLETIKLMFSLDMVGMLEENKGLILKGMGTMLNGPELAKTLAEKYDFAIRKIGDSFERRTDTAPFAGKGIPSVHVFTGTKSPYHKPEDKYDLLDYDGMAAITLYMKEFLAQLSALPEINPLPSFESQAMAQSSKKAGRISIGISTYFGSGFHEYDDTFYRANSLFSTAGGIFIQFPIGKFITLQQEVLYDLNRSKMEGGSFARHSLTLPFNIQFGTPRLNVGDIRFYTFAGPYYRYSFNGSAASTKLNFTVYKQEEWGYNYGIGLDVFKFTVGFTRRTALTGLLIGNQNSIFNTNSYLSLSYRF
jgi:aminopeptidase YwaD